MAAARCHNIITAAFARKRIHALIHLAANEDVAMDLRPKTQGTQSISIF